ncbi:MAG TPA: hypothetical protein VIP51_05810 [Eoetvoesiella sp.]
MHNRTETVRFPLQALTVFTMFAACLFSAAVLAQGTSLGTTPPTLSPQAQYKLDVERCKTGQTNQDQATCMQEAGAALEEAKRNRLNNGQAGSYQQNATDRCNALPQGERQDCLTQMAGQNTTVQGSIGGGGVLRETTITTTPSQPDALTAPATPQMPGTPSTAPMDKPANSIK